MVDSILVAISDVAYVLGMDPNKLNRWYKDSLSGFKQLKEKGELNKHDMKKGLETIRVPIVEKKNIGEYIGIDEKYLDNVYHTALYNLETSKIMLMVKSTKSNEIYRAIAENFTNEQMYNVKVITKDGAENFDWVARQAFPKAIRVIDKYHVISEIFDTLDSLRNYLKNKYTFDLERKKIENEKLYKEAVKKAKEEKKHPPSIEFYKVHEPIFENGDTTKQLLSRSKHLLFMYEEKWNEEQTQRAKILFREYPDIENIYRIIIKFRSWYSEPKFFEDPHKLSSYFDNWANGLKIYKYEAIKSLVLYLKKYKQNIINYFTTGMTNAVAESINRQLNKLIGKSYGIRDLDFFYFRAKVYLT